MSYRGNEVTQFIDANERQVEEHPSTKLAQHIAEGDVLGVPGAELHEDLAGLVFTFSVDEPANREGAYVNIPDGRGGIIWFKEGETVRLDFGTYAESRFE